MRILVFNCKRETRGRCSQKRPSAGVETSGHPPRFSDSDLFLNVAPENEAINYSPAAPAPCTYIYIYIYIYIYLCLLGSTSKLPGVHVLGKSQSMISVCYAVVGPCGVLISYATSFLGEIMRYKMLCVMRS